MNICFMWDKCCFFELSRRGEKKLLKNDYNFRGLKENEGKKCCVGNIMVFRIKFV